MVWIFTNYWSQMYKLYQCFLFQNLPITLPAQSPRPLILWKDIKNQGRQQMSSLIFPCRWGNARADCWCTQGEALYGKCTCKRMHWSQGALRTGSGRKDPSPAGSSVGHSPLLLVELIWVFGAGNHIWLYRLCFIKGLLFGLSVTTIIHCIVFLKFFHKCYVH